MGRANNNIQCNFSRYTQCPLCCDQRPLRVPQRGGIIGGAKRWDYMMTLVLVKVGRLDRIFEPKMASSERQTIVERWQFYINQLLNEQKLKQKN